MDDSSTLRADAARHSKDLHVIDVTYRTAFDDTADVEEIRLLRAHARRVLAELEERVLLDGSDSTVLAEIEKLRGEIG